MLDINLRILWVIIRPFALYVVLLFSLMVKCQIDNISASGAALSSRLVVVLDRKQYLVVIVPVVLVTAIIIYFCFHQSSSKLQK